MFHDTGSSADGRDRALMESLWLRTSAFTRDWTDLGTVTVCEAESEDSGARPASTVTVEVSALPAHFWRFTIVRPREGAEAVDGVKPVERFVLSTGSGRFSTYWPTAKMVAEHMLTIEGEA